MTTTASERRDRFRDLHRSGTWVIPNPFDVGSALLLQHRGFPALATTSSGFAATLGRLDQHVVREELVAHVSAICTAVDVPVNVDAERLYATDLDGIAETVDQLATAGAAGLSIEDYDPATGRIDDIAIAVERVEAAADACRRHGLVLTARAENRLYGISDLDDTVARLCAYRDVGAEVAYAPGLFDLAEIRRVVDEVGLPVNVLALKGGPSVGELAGVGVRRVSTGGGLAWAAYGGLLAAADELREHGTSTYLGSGLTYETRAAAFADPRR
jgi:2-methylisocitrate lyase-like PEP mutase family enzyme